jgi:hypothetical protein
MNSTEIISAIISGTADENLDGVVEAARDRAKALGAALKYTLRPGDKVKCTSRTIKPVRLRDASGTVKLVNRTTVTVDFTEELGPRGIFRMPFQYIEKVAA